MVLMFPLIMLVVVGACSLLCGQDFNSAEVSCGAIKTLHLKGTHYLSACSPGSGRCK